MFRFSTKLYFYLVEELGEERVHVVLRESNLEEVLGEVSSEEAVKSSDDIVGEDRVVGEEGGPVGGPARFVIAAVPIPLGVAAVKRTNVDLLHALEHAGDDVGEGLLAGVGRLGPGLEARVGEGANLKNETL